MSHQVVGPHDETNSYEDAQYQKMLKQLVEEKRGNASTIRKICCRIPDVIIGLVSWPFFAPVLAVEYVRLAKREKAWCEELRRRNAVVVDRA